MTESGNRDSATQHSAAAKVKELLERVGELNQDQRIQLLTLTLDLAQMSTFINQTESARALFASAFKLAFAFVREQCSPLLVLQIIRLPAAQARLLMSNVPEDVKERIWQQVPAENRQTFANKLGKKPESN